MKNGWKNLVIFLVGFLLVILIGLPILGGFVGGGSYGWMPMMGGWGRGYHMFGAFPFFGGFFMMIAMFLVPLAFVALLVAGILAVFKGLHNPPAQPPVQRCGNCNKPVQADWANCPYCAEKL